MKKILTNIILLSVLSSCSFFNTITSNSVRFDFYKNVAINSDQNEVFSKTGPSLFDMEFENKKMYFFRTGFVEFTDGKVSRRGLYDNSFNSELSFSSKIRIGSNGFDSCISLSVPKSVKKIGEQYVITYKNGGIVISGNKVVKVADKLFTNDLVFKLGINAFSEMSVKMDSTYLLLPGDKDINPNDLQYREVQLYMEQSLAEEGMTVVKDIKKADYIVLIKYGISDPKEDIKVVSRPVFIPTFVPGQTATFYNGFGNVATISTAGTWGSQYAGQNTETIKTVSYNRWLNVEAFDNKVLQESKTLRPVWKVISNSIGPIGDLRVIVPALTYGVGAYVNKDTQKQLNLQVDGSTLNTYIIDSKLKPQNFEREVASKK